MKFTLEICQGDSKENTEGGMHHIGTHRTMVVDGVVKVPPREIASAVQLLHQPYLLSRQARSNRSLAARTNDG